MNYLPGNIDIPLVICIFSFMETKMLSNVPRLLLLLLFWLFSFFLFSLLLLFAMFITICNNKTTPRDVSQIREREILKTYFYLSKLWKYHLQMFPHFSYTRTCLYKYRSWRILTCNQETQSTALILLEDEMKNWK